MGKKHPVWDVYDQLRTARFNMCYYAARVSQLRRANLWIEISLAVTAPSSAVAGLWFWDTEVGAYVWRVLGVIVACLAVAKPILKLTDRIKLFEETLTGYRTLANDLEKITFTVRERQTYDQAAQKMFHEALERKRVISEKEPEYREKEQLKERCYQTVINQLPNTYFFVPKE